MLVPSPALCFCAALILKRELYMYYCFFLLLVLFAVSHRLPFEDRFITMIFLQDQDHLSLNLSLAEKTNLISELETQNEMLRSGSVNSSSGVNEELVAACESDKVAASRAMAQNEQLKEQLQELQMAVIKQVGSE